MSKKITVIFLLSLLVSMRVFATHQRAAEITYRWLGDLTYEFTITMYTYTPSPADDVRSFLPINWGDNSTNDIPRIVFQALPDNYTLNVYRMNHTFPAAGNYTISVEDPNRNFGVVNIPNSVNVPMFVESELFINPFLGNNNSVELLNAPIDQGCVGKLFTHNPSAYDPDGDSLSYRLVSCKGASGLDIPGFTQPQASNSFAIDPVTGDLIWDTPLLQGEYNVAFMVEEWRQGIKIGSVTRDMQIVIGACDNNPPEIISVDDTCVIAGNTLTFDVIAIDPEGNSVTLTANGGPFEVAQNPASIVPDPATGTPEAQTSFFWNTNCSHIRRSSYTALFRARDNHPEVSLTNLKSVNIRVIAPPIENLTATALGNGINLQWDAATCANAIGYKLYRRSGYFGYVPGFCETGVPAYTGYQLLTSLNNTELTTYRDDGQGNGLVQGIDYCYLITAVFQDGSESITSNEACASLKRDLPVMTHVSNDSLNLESGHVLTAWSPPSELDTLQYPGPYRYQLVRNLNGSTATVFTGYGLNDTLFADNSVNINQTEAAVSYAVQLENDANGLIGTSRSASSIRLQLTPSDQSLRVQWTTNVPWINTFYEVFRKNPSDNHFESIGLTSDTRFVDTALINGSEYCYYIKSTGSYSVPGIVKPITNFSHIVCGIPEDNIAPCTPELTVSTNCETIENTLYWQGVEADSCENDATGYYIYYTPSASLPFTLIDSVLAATDSSYVHLATEYVTGCYFIRAFDENGNVSPSSNIVCVDFDTCPVYELPNVFTPNADQFNDLLQPIGYPSANPKAVVERIEMKIFNRWGNVVFETNDPEVNWDGKNMQNGQDCADGVYFYVCDVYFESFEGPVKQTLQGSVSIYR